MKRMAQKEERRKVGTPTPGLAQAQAQACLDGLAALRCCPAATMPCHAMAPKHKTPPSCHPRPLSHPPPAPQPDDFDVLEEEKENVHRLEIR